MTHNFHTTMMAPHVTKKKKKQQQPKKKASTVIAAPAETSTSGVVSRNRTSMDGSTGASSSSESGTAPTAAAREHHDGMKRATTTSSTSQQDNNSSTSNNSSKRGGGRRRKRGGGGGTANNNNNSKNDDDKKHHQSNNNKTNEGFNRSCNDQQQQQKQQRHHQSDNSSRKRRSSSRQQQRHQQRTKKKQTPSASQDDDIEQQLQRQRQKQHQQAEKEKEKERLATNNEEEDGDGSVKSADDDDHDNTTTTSADADAAVISMPPETLGRYRYDAKRKAYFPSNYSFPEDEDEDDKSAAEDERSSSSFVARYRTFPHSPRLRIGTVTTTTTTTIASSAFRQELREEEEEEEEVIIQNSDSQKDRRRTTTPSLSSSSSTTTSAFPYPVASCSNLSQRLGLVSTWAGRAVLESFGWTPSAALLPITMVTLGRDGREIREEHQRAWSLFHKHAMTSSSSGGLLGGIVARPIDIECKIGTVPWTRTFDVAGPACTSSHKNPPPIVTVTDTEYVVKQQRGRIGHLDFRRHSLGASVHSPRFLDAGGNYNLGTLDTAQGRSSLLLSKINIEDEDDHDSLLGVYYDIPLPQNDFDSWEGEAIVFAPALHHPTPPGSNSGNSISRTAHAYTPWLLCLEHASFRQFQRESFPNSETLCVEADPSNADSFYFGHRNGQVSLFDINSGQKHCPSTSNKDNNLQSFGSAMSIHPLSFSHRQVLVRGSQGSCRLYDFRKLGSSSSSGGANPGGKDLKNNKNGDPSLVCEMTPFPLLTDSDNINGQHRGQRLQRCKRLTNRCNGVVTNPEETLVISPYVDVQGEDQEEMPSLGFWSLHTGDWIGSKPLAPFLTTTDGTSGSNVGGDGGEHFPATTQWGVSWVELNKRVTPAWEWRKPKLDDNQDESNDDDDDDDDNDLRPRPGSFGLWYKCGQSMAGPGLPASAGSIHHVFATGKPSA